MAALNFPTAPTVDQVYTANGNSWKWNGSSWNTLNIINVSNSTGTLAITNGGTGATTAPDALTNLGAYPATNPSGFTNNTGTVTSVSMTVPTGLSISGSPITTSGTLALTLTAGYSIPTTTSQTNWDTAFTDRNKWDGGATGLVAATGRTSLGGTTVGQNFFTLTNPTAITFPRINADNTISALDAATFRTAIGAGTSSTTGTVTSVGGTGTVSGLTLSGTVTTSGNLTLGGTLAVTASNFASQTANTFLAAPNGTAGVPTFRTIAAADVPTLNQNTTGTASNVTGTVAIANGGTGATTAATARTNLGATTLGANLFTLANVAAISFPRINADNTVSSLDAATFRTAIGAGTSSTTGTVTSVSALTIGTTGTDISSTVATSTTTPVITLNIPTASATNRGALSSADWTTFNNKTSNTGTVTSVGGTGTVSGLTLSGTVTTSGNLTLGGTLAVTPSNFASQTANTVLAAPNGAAGTPTFRALVAADIPTLNQNTTGTASNVTGTVAIANGGTGATTAATALTNLGAYPATNPSGYTSNTGTVTSVSATSGTGIGITGSPITTSGTLTITNTAPNVTTDISITHNASSVVVNSSDGLDGTVNAATTSLAGVMSSTDKTKLDGIATGATANTGTVTSVSGTGTVSGLSLSGTVTTSGSISLSGTLSASIDNITDEHRLFNNMGDAHSTNLDFNTVSNFGTKYFQAGTNGPTGTVGHQFYGFSLGLGNDYGINLYTSQFYWPRTSLGGSRYIYIRDRENGTWGSWDKIYAGYADSAGTAGTITGTYSGTLTSSQVTTALGYTPYNSTNPNGYTTNTGTVTSVATGTGLTGGPITTSGTISLTNTGVTAATYGSATTIPVIAVDAQGRITSASNQTVSGGQYFGSAATKAIAYNSNTIAENVTVTSGNNGLSAGPITINTGNTVTVESGSVWVIV